MAGTPTVGARVITADRQDLGKVKEISGDCFKVDAPLQQDYWLGSNCIASSPGNEVRLSFIKDTLGSMKYEGEHKGFHPH